MVSRTNKHCVRVADELNGLLRNAFIRGQVYLVMGDKRCSVWIRIKFADVDVFRAVPEQTRLITERLKGSTKLHLPDGLVDNHLDVV